MIDTVRFWGAVIIVCLFMSVAGYVSFGLGYNAGMYRERVRNLVTRTSHTEPTPVDDVDDIDVGSTGLVLPPLEAADGNQ